MANETKDILEDLGRRFEDFKTLHTRELQEIKNKGTPSAETVQAVERANASITEVKTKMAEIEQTAVKAKVAAETLETELARRQQKPAAVEAERNAATAFFALAAARNKRPAPTGEPDIEAYRAYRNAFFAYASRGEGSLAPDIKAALVVGSDPAGGFLFPADTSGRIAQLVFESSPFREVVSVQATDADSVEGQADLNEATSGWSAETGTRAETATPDLGAWKIPLHELYAMPRASNRSLDMRSMFNVESWLSGKVATRFNRQEANAIAVGNGVAKPRGFATYPAGTPSAATWQVIQQIPTGLSGGFLTTAVGADVLFDIIYALKSLYRANARWAAPRLVYAAVRKLKDQQGQYLWQPGLQPGQPDRLLSYPTIEAEDMAPLGASSLSLAIADWAEAYQLLENPAIRLIRDNVTQKGWVNFFTYTYRGGDVVNFEAIKLMRFNT